MIAESEHSFSAETELHPLGEATLTSQEVLAVGARDTPWTSPGDPGERVPVDADRLELSAPRHTTCPALSPESACAPAARCSSEG